jgi:hypothetical protein
MISNPERKTRGGDVEGQEMTDVENGLGPATSVASASYDPGYPIELDTVTMADLKQGYASYGVAIGAKRGAGYL